jgi:hypothetical protein
MSEAAMVALGVRSEGDADGILIKRFGPAHLWGHWDHTQLWNPQAMPLTIRMLIENGTSEDWEAVDVVLVCPKGWQAEGRPPRQWPRPQAMATEAGVNLPAVPAFSRAVAPFWVAAPPQLALDLGWHEGPHVPFHTTTQPGPGITLYAVGLDAPVEAAFEAAVRITTRAGDTIQRQLVIPVRVLPR